MEDQFEFNFNAKVRNIINSRFVLRIVWDMHVPEGGDNEYFVTFACHNKKIMKYSVVRSTEHRKGYRTYEYYLDYRNANRLIVNSDHQDKVQSRILHLDIMRFCKKHTFTFNDNTEFKSGYLVSYGNLDAEIQRSMPLITKEVKAKILSQIRDYHLANNAFYDIWLAADKEITV